MTVMMTGGVSAQLRPREIAGAPGGAGKTETTAPPPQPRRDADPAAGASPAPRPAALRAEAPGAPEAPAGADPELWAILTAEERDLFARMNTMGPLTYGRPARAAHAGEPMLARGARLDVRA